MPNRRTHAALLAALALPACAGRPATTPRARPVASADSLEAVCAQTADEICARLLACGSPAFVQFALGGSASCVARYRRSCLEDGALPGSGWTPAVVRECARQRREITCTELLAGRMPDACHAVGRREDGSPCVYEDQCRSRYCRQTEGALCGVCGPPQPAGAPCEDQSACVRGLACAPGTRICVRPGAQSASCDVDAAPCDVGLVCRGLGGRRTCQPAGMREGTPCNASPTDPAHVCDATRGLYCQQPEGRCRRYRAASTGEPCGRIDGTLVLCDQGARCEGATPAQPAGTCGPPLRTGDACAVGAERTCPAGDRCVANAGGDGGTCAAPRAATCP